jgi:hypothetical protein
LTGGAPAEEGGIRATAATLFVSDPTAEAERIAQALRGAGYAVVDVPLSMLVARVAVQHPRVILVDADSEGALEVVERMRELPDADAIDVLFMARPGGTMASSEEALAHEGSGLFVRPVEVSALVRKVEALTGGVPPPPAEARSSAPPPISAPTKRRSSSPPSLPPASMRAPSTQPAPAEPKPSLVSSHPVRPSKIPSEPPTSITGSPRRLAGLAPPISLELQQLLADAEQRVQAGSDAEPGAPSPEDEIEAVLPAELLAALDEPLEEEDDEDDLMPPPRVGPASASREPASELDALRSDRAPATGAAPTYVHAPPPRARADTGEEALTPPPHTHGGGTHSGGTGAGISTTGNSGAQARSDLDPPSATSTASAGAPSEALASSPATWSALQHVAAANHAREPDPHASAAPAQPALDEIDPDLASEPPWPSVLGPGDAMRVVARAIAARHTGSLCVVAAPEAERRVLLREGDVVTLGSTVEDESLLAFLGVRGDLPKETVRRLASKFAPFGRHAGAALVARGYLRQDQMWPTLRAHAEWLLARVLKTQAGRLILEPQAPGRLAGEPSVFGGSTGAEAFVEVVRRIVPPAEAVERLGGAGARLADGPEVRLLAECALGPADLEDVRNAAGHALRDLLEAAPDGDLATVLFALSQLGVVEVLRAPASLDDLDEPDSSADVAALDSEAIRERVRARLQLVDDGDYFAVLGVTREATGYEVRRAFLELRRAFDPSRVLTPEVADLAEDVRKIAMVLDEAYDILKDGARRERYRRAIEATPDAL